MKIGGIQPVTLLDYPQKLAAIIFTQGCNMRCPFCYNPSLVLPQMTEGKEGFSEEDVLAFLKKRKKYLDAVVISGGEPTIQADLKDFCKKIKKMGYQLKIDTNGLRSEIISDLISQNLVDYIAMDIKGPFTDYKNFCGVDADESVLARSVKIIKESGLPYEFRSTLVKPMHKENDVLEMAKAVKGAKTYYLQNFTKQAKLVDDNFSGTHFTAIEMENFKNIADKLVKKCIIR